MGQDCIENDRIETNRIENERPAHEAFFQPQYIDYEQIEEGFIDDHRIRIDDEVDGSAASPKTTITTLMVSLNTVNPMKILI